MEKQTVILSAGLAVCLTVGGLWYHTSRSTEVKPPASALPTSDSARASRSESSRFSYLLDPGLPQGLKEERLARLDPASIQPADIEELYALFDHRPAPGALTTWGSTLNEVMEQILRLGLSPERITPSLLALMRDDTAPPLLRDFAAQHLGDWIATNPPAYGAPRETDPAKTAEALEGIVALAMDSSLGHTPAPGSALRTLGHLHRNGGFPEVPTGEGKDHVLTPTFTNWLGGVIAGSSGVCEEVRNCAIDAAGLLELETMRPSILALAQNEESSGSLRLVSIATLGHLGQAEDKPFLTELAQSNSRYRFAAQSALKRLASE